MNSFLGFLKTIVALFQMLCMCDMVNTNQSQTCFFILVGVKIMSLLDLFNDMKDLIMMEYLTHSYFI
jgi:hypothetical protein